MKNRNLISKFEDLKKSKSLESVEGSMLQSIKGGKNSSAPCQIKCKPNSACNGNNKSSDLSIG